MNSKRTLGVSQTRRLVLSLITALMNLGVAGLAEGNSTTVLEYETAGSTASIAPSASASLVTLCNLTAGSGLGIVGSSTFNFNSWDPASTTFEEANAAGDHWNWGFEVTQLGATVNLTAMDIRLDRSGSGPDDFEIRMSLNVGSAILVQSHDYADTSSGVEFLNIDVSGLGELADGITVDANGIVTNHRDLILTSTLIAGIDTKWVIKRSLDLVNFTEIYSYHGPSATTTSQPGVSATFDATGITVSETNPPDPRAFYRFVAEQL